MSSQEPDNSGSLQAAGPAPDEPGAPPQRPGARLLAERRAQGLSLGDVARQLKLSVRQVEALERDEYGAFPGAVFVRGFLRNYAKLLQLDPEGLVAQAAIAPAPSAPAGPSHPVPLPQRDSTAGRRSRFGFGTLALGLALAIVVLAAIYDARNRPAPVSLGPTQAVPREQAPAPQHADSPPPAASDASTAQGPAPAAPAAAVSETAVSDATAPAAGGDGAGAPAAAAQPASAAPASPETAEVRLTFDAESWVEIKDGTGAVIYSQLNPAGGERMVSGQPPLDLVIGNARSVRLAFRGRPIDLAPHTRVDVARVRLE